MTGLTMQETLAAQRGAFMAELPVSVAVRKDRLRRLQRMVEDNADRFAAALSQDFGHRSREQSLMTDVSSTVTQIKHNLAHVARWARPEKRPVPFPIALFGCKARIEYQPKGVIGVIAPWNFPVQLCVGPVSGAFAAGTRAMVKTSELTPAVAAALEAASADYFDRTELAFFSGGPDIGQQFAALPFDHLIFTGGTAIGRHILHAAADNLTPVTLELGGKSPAIVGTSTDIAKAAQSIAMGKMLNAGQICIAPDYAFVPAAQENAFVAGMRDAVTTMYPNLLANDDYTSVINERHHVRLSGYLDDARAKGAEVVTIKPVNEDFTSTNSNKMPLHLVLNATDDMAVMNEEIFGPILPIRRYSAIGEVIDHINAHDRPLALYYFGKDETEKRQVLDRTISGGVTLNDVLFHIGVDDLPFGGTGPSGMGSYHGIEGFRTFSHAKSVFQQGWVDLAKLGGMRPPYKRRPDALR